MTNDTRPWIEQAVTIREKQRQFNHVGCQANIYKDVGWQKVMFFKKKYISFNCETLIQCQANCNRQVWAPKFFMFNNDNTLENMTRGIDWTGQISRTQARCGWTELRQDHHNNRLMDAMRVVIDQLFVQSKSWWMRLSESWLFTIRVLWLFAIGVLWWCMWWMKGSKQAGEEGRKEGTKDKAQYIHAYDRNPLESGKSGVQVVGFPCQLQQTDNFMKPVFLSARFLCHGKPCIVQILLGLLSQDFFHTHIVLSMLNCHVGWWWW